MNWYQFNDPFLKRLNGQQQVALRGKISQISLSPGYMEDRLDTWMANFRGSNEKSLALKVFMLIDFYTEQRIEKIILQYRRTVEQYLVERGGNIKDVIFVVPEGAADSADFHAYKLVKVWGVDRNAVVKMDKLSSLATPGKFFVFFNDTHGSGNQFITEFSAFINRVGSASCFIASIAMAKDAYERFKKDFPDTIIIPDIPTQNIDNMKEFSVKERELLRKIGNRVYNKYPIGYGNCGLLVAYHFQCPNNSLPMVWADGTNNRCPDEDGCVSAYPWTPLFAYREKTDSGLKSKNSGTLLVPFVGLRSLRDTDRSVFFGRDAQKNKVVERIAKGSVIVVGASGAGKSSLVWA